MRLTTPIYVLKRDAKRRARARGIALHQALDAVATEHGYQGWSHLAASHERPADRVFDTLAPGDMLLIGARPGHGKTLLALELAVMAARAGWQSHFFTLDWTAAEVARRLRLLGIDPAALGDGVRVDTSDEICADHIVARLGPAPRTLAVIDYLQLLDQKRSHPALQDQIQALKAHAVRTGAVIAAISQIDRTFDGAARRVPGRADVRQPNPVDLSAFNKTCFLHEGEIALSAA